MSANFIYTSLTTKISFVASDGQWSSWNNGGNTLILGDGEIVTMNLSFEEKKTDAYISNIVYDDRQFFNGRQLMSEFFYLLDNFLAVTPFSLLF